MSRVAALGRRGAVELVAVGLDDDAPVRPEEVRASTAPMRTLTCGLGIPYAAHSRRKRSSSTDRTSAGSTAPIRIRRSLAFPRCRGREITSAASGAGGMWSLTWACSKHLARALRESTDGEVEQRPDRRGDRDAAVNRHVGGRQPLAVHDDPVASAVSRRRRHDHLGDRRARQQPPECSGRDVAQHRSDAEREHRGDPARLARPRYVPDGVDAGVPSDQPALVVTFVDLVPRQPDRLELGARDVAVLPLRDATNVISCSHREH